MDNKKIKKNLLTTIMFFYVDDTFAIFLREKINHILQEELMI